MTDELLTKLEQIKQDKDTNLLPENLKEGVTCLGITGTLKEGSSNIKLFETEEEMQNDSTAKENDLAVVYRNEIQNMTSDTQTQYITFPETVILPEVFTDSIYVMLHAVDDIIMAECQIRLDTSTFMFDEYTETGMISVLYTSSDGKTYTRQYFSSDTSDLTNPVDLGTIIECVDTENWNDNLGYFMQTGGMYFGGLYKYNINITDKSRVQFRSLESLQFNKEQKLITLNDIKFPEVYDFNLICEITNTIQKNEGLRMMQTYLDKDNNVCALGIKASWNTDLRYIFDNDGNIDSLGATDLESIYFYKLNLNDKSYEFIKSSNATSKTCYYILLDGTTEEITLNCVNISEFNMKSLLIFASTTGSLHCRIYVCGLSEGIYIMSLDNPNTSRYSWEIPYTYNEYRFTQNQYNLTSSNQLLPNISAYGRNGNITGDESVYNNLDTKLMLNTLFNTNVDNLPQKYVYDGIYNKPIDVVQRYKIVNNDDVHTMALITSLENLETKSSSSSTYTSTSTINRYILPNQLFIINRRYADFDTPTSTDEIYLYGIVNDKIYYTITTNSIKKIVNGGFVHNDEIYFVAANTTSVGNSLSIYKLNNDTLTSVYDISGSSNKSIKMVCYWNNYIYIICYGYSSSYNSGGYVKRINMNTLEIETILTDLGYIYSTGSVVCKCKDELEFYLCNPTSKILFRVVIHKDNTYTNYSYDLSKLSSAWLSHISGSFIYEDKKYITDTGTKKIYQLENSDITLIKSYSSGKFAYTDFSQLTNGLLWLHNTNIVISPDKLLIQEDYSDFSSNYRSNDIYCTNDIMVSFKYKEHSIIGSKYNIQYLSESNDSEDVDMILYIEDTSVNENEDKIPLGITSKVISCTQKILTTIEYNKVLSTAKTIRGGVK